MGSPFFLFTSTCLFIWSGVLSEDPNEDVPSYADLVTVPETFLEDNKVTLSCESDCEEPCNVSWYRNNVSLKWGNVQNHEIQRLTFADSGKYYCRVSGEQRSVNSNIIDIQVEGISNVILSKSIQGDIQEGVRGLTLSCDATCNPDCSFSIYKNGQSVKEGNRMVITVVSRDDSGSYQCTAQNRIRSRDSNIVPIDVQWISNVRLSKSIQGDIQEGVKGLTLSCDATCNPDCSFSISKNGQSVRQGNHMVITVVSRDDSGSYQCNAQNRIKNRKSNIVRIDVQYGPKKVTANFSGKTSLVLSERDVIFRCQADCRPSCQYTWIKDRTRHPGQTYRIQTVKASDDGRYSCMARNGIGNDVYSPERMFDIMVPPLELLITSSMEYPSENDDISLKCSTSPPCKPSCTFEWTQKSTSQRIGDSSLLHFRNVKRDKAGRYECLASNNYGKELGRKELHIFYSEVTIHITGQSSNNVINIKEGDIFPQISCSTDCFEPCNNTQLYFKKLGTGGLRRLNQGRSSRRKATPEDTGTYLCKADYYSKKDRRTKVITSETITIKVLHASISMSTMATTLKVTESDRPPALSCSVSCDPPCTDLSVYKNTKLFKYLTNNENFLGSSPVYRDVMGRYICRAKTSEKSWLSSKGVYVDIQYKPEIDAQFGNKLIFKENDSTKLSWRVDSNPAAQFSVKFKTQSLNGNLVREPQPNESKVSSYSLQMTDVSCWSIGEYKAIATNDIGEYTQDFSVTVLCAPRLLGRNRKPDVVEGKPIYSDLVQQWNFYSYPESKVNLTFQDTNKESLQSLGNDSSITAGLKDVQNGSILTLRIANITEYHFGKYKVLLQNGEGSLRLTLALHPSGPPLPPSSVEVDCSSQQNAILSWKPSFPGGSTQTFIAYRRFNSTWNKVKENITDNKDVNGRVSVLVDHLTGGVHYEFMITAINNDEIEVKASNSANCTIQIIHENKSSMKIVDAVIVILIPILLICIILVLVLYGRKRSNKINMKRFKGEENNTDAWRNSLVEMNNQVAQNNDEDGMAAIEEQERSMNLPTQNKNHFNEVMKEFRESRRTERVITATKPVEGKYINEPDKGAINTAYDQNIYDTPKSSRMKNPDGLVYIEVEFSKPSTEMTGKIIGDDDRTDYTDVQFVKQ